MKITLVGMGSGAPGSLTAAGLETLRGAELIIGARRLLENLPEGCTANRAALYKTDEICALLRQTDCAETAVVFSGDTGFYSGAAALCRALDDAGLPYTVLPGVSSVQLLAAALGRPWQGWRLVSAHGCACDPVAACRAGGITFFLKQVKHSIRIFPFAKSSSLYTVIQRFFTLLLIQSSKNRPGNSLRDLSIFFIIKLIIFVRI